MIGAEEKAAVAEIFDKGGVLFAHGYHDKRGGVYRVRTFEKEFAAHLGSTHATAVNTGTAALKTGLAALGVAPGTEVITQAFTFVATVEAILDLRAKPVVLNVDASLGLDPDEVEKAITPRTKAILPVHMHGFAADLGRILEIGKRHGIPVFEDNCQSLGAKWDGKWLGTLGDIGAFSFDYNKAITTGEGGMVLTRSDKLARFCREYHDHGHENNPALPRGRDTRTIYGFNYRMTEMQAAVGLVQLRKLDRAVADNKVRYEAFMSAFGNAAELRKQFPQSEPLWDTIMFKLKNAADRQRMIDLVNASGIGTKNVPDAMEWHFAGHWDHMLSASEISAVKPTADLLNSYVSLPVLLKWTPEQYANLGRKLKEAL